LKKRFAIGVAVSVALLGLLYAHYRDEIRLDDLLDSFATASLGLIAVVYLMHLLILGLKAVRWDVVLRTVPHERGLPSEREGDPAARWLVWDALFLGYFGNYVLPAKLGEVGRSLLYARRAEVAFPSVLATIIFERFIDALTLIAFFYVALVFLPETLPDWVGMGAQTVGAVSVVGFAVLWILWRHLPRDGSGEGLMGRLSALAARFRDGLSVMQDQKATARAVGWTVLIWALECVSVWIALKAFDVRIEAIWVAAVLNTIITSFGIAAPSAPGGIGIHQGISLVILHEFFGADPEDALALSLMVTFSVIFWTVPLGLYGLWRQGASMSELQGELETTTETRGEGPASSQ
jgi:glycosyltransferase 2 family protein